MVTNSVEHSTLSQPQTQVETRPIDLVLSRIQAKSYRRGYMACCPAHPDSNPSLMIWEDEEDGHAGIMCLASCTRQAICEALGITERDLYLPDGRYTRPQRTERKIDLMDLARDKIIHPKFLFSLGLQDEYLWGVGKRKSKVIRIPYYLANGQEYTKARIRTALKAKHGSFWEGNDPLIPYGLHKLDMARQAGYVVIVEGESDCWTCWLHGIPALGIPGAANASCLNATWLNGIERAYILQEPDEAGGQFPVSIARRLNETGYLGQCYAVSLEAKDPNALHQKLFSEHRVKAFPEELQRALDAARPVEMHQQAEEQKPTLEAIQPLVQNAVEKQNIDALYALAEKIITLQPIDQAKVKSIIQEGMKRCKAFSWSGYKKHLAETEKKRRAETRAERAYVTGKPQILLGRQLHEEVDDTLDALYKANQPEPVIYVRGGKLTRWRLSEKATPLIESIDENSLIERLTRVAEFVTYNEQKDTYSSTHPTSRIARTILAQPASKFPPLEGITEVPIMRLDGTILDKAGYDAETRMLYIPQAGLHIPSIPSNPTSAQVKESRDYAFGFIREFPYVGNADRANAFALLLTSVTRSLYGLVPMVIVDATKPGTGKGLLSKVASMIATGRSCASTTQPSTEEEWTKILTGILLSGSSIISIDNIERVVNSSKLASFLTADTWKERVLGTNTLTELPQRCIVMANGNNVLLGGDIPRRCYRVRMDAGISQPWTREGFTYDPLLQHVAQNRGKIISALLTMARAWYVAGRPAPAEKIPTIGEYSEWANVIGGILSYAGVQGFLANNEQLYEETDIEGAAWELFLSTWLEVFGKRTVTIKELKENLQINQPFADSLPDVLSSAMMNPNKSFERTLSHALRKKEGTPFGPRNLKLCRGEPDSHSKNATWCVAVLAVLEGIDLRLRGFENDFFLHDEKEEKNHFQIQHEANLTHLTPLTPQTSKDREVIEI